MENQNAFARIRQEFETLKQSSSIIASLLETSGLGFAVITPDNHVIDVNRTMLDWFPDVDPATFPLCHESFFCRQPEVCFNCPAQRALQAGGKQTAVQTCQTATGPKTFKVTCTPLVGSESEAWGVLSLIEDISDQAGEQERVRELEARCAQIIENASDAIITLNRQAEIMSLNKKARDLSGYSAEEVQGKSIVALLPEEVRDRQRDRVEKIFTGQLDDIIGKVLEGLCRRKDGTIVPIDMTLSLQHSLQETMLTLIVRDVTKRKAYEEGLKTQAQELEEAVQERTRALERTEQLYRELVETANDAIISADKSGTIISFNRKAEEIFGCGREKRIGQKLAGLFAPEDWRGIENELRQDTVLLVSKAFEVRGIKKDSTTVPVECTVSVFEKNGDYNLTLIARDITIRKSLEHKVQEYTAKLEEKVRDRTYELTASQQLLKNKVSELSILQEISEALASAMDLEDVLNIILVGATSHHGLGFNRAFLFLTSEDGACLEGTVAIGPTDGQEAQKIWSEILGKKLTLKEILQSYTNKAGRIDTHVNELVRSIRIPFAHADNILVRAVLERQTYNITDAERDPRISDEVRELMHCNAFALIPLMAKDSVLGVLWADNAITKNIIENRDIEQLRAFALNASLAIEKSNLYKNIQEKVVALDAVNRELKENRDRLIRTEKLAAVGEMSATVAHGIRNPLVSIGGFARRMLKKEELDSTSRKYLQIIVEEIDRLEIILSELLDFVRPRTLNMQQSALADVIDTVLGVFQCAFETKSVSVMRNVQPGLPMVDLDQDQFIRVLQNLFNNAMDAMPGGGTLNVSVALEGDWIRTSISDTGVGIDDNDVEKVFHPFFTSKSTGSGLGLAVCNQIISIHGGHIKLRRQLPHGMIFDVYLPLRKDGV